MNDNTQANNPPTTTSEPMKGITFVVACNNRAILEQNLLASPGLRTALAHEVLIQEGFSSAAAAYNAGIDEAQNELLIFIHQDVYLPEGWLTRLQDCVAALESQDSNWGVLGCYGACQDGLQHGHIYTPRFGAIGKPFDGGREVQTLDEVVLIIRKSSRLRFSPDLPHFHFYGSDLCLRARSLGIRSYAIDAFCVHNSNYPRVLPPEFYTCYRFIKRTWSRYLPIHTPCIRISRFDRELHKRRLREAHLRLLQREVEPCRTQDPASLIASISPGDLSSLG